MLQPTYQKLLRKFSGAGGGKCCSKLTIILTSVHVTKIKSQTEAGSVLEMKYKQRGYLNSSSE